MLEELCRCLRHVHQARPSLRWPLLEYPYGVAVAKWEVLIPRLHKGSFECRKYLLRRSPHRSPYRDDLFDDDVFAEASGAPVNAPGPRATLTARASTTATANGWQFPEPLG